MDLANSYRQLDFEGGLYPWERFDWDAETMMLSFDEPARDGRGNNLELQLIE